MTAALDTNLLAHAHGLHGAATQLRTQAVLDDLVGRAGIPGQVAVEFYNLLIRKGGNERPMARRTVLQWIAHFSLVQPAGDSALQALELAADHQLSIWDALVVAQAAAAGCAVLLSEDLQHGFQWRGVTVVNPFTAPRHRLLTALLGPI